jgi:hypothetical protein
MKRARNASFYSAVGAVVLYALSGFQSVLAQNGQRERAGILIGGFITDRNTEARLDSNSGRGTEVNFEKDLGLDGTTSVGRLGGYVWFKPKHRFDFSVFDLSRTASSRINETIEFGDETFVIDTVVYTKFDLGIYKIDYTFAPISRDRAFFGITGGLYVASTDIELSEATLGRRKGEGLTAPLPVIGFRGDYELTDRLTVGGAAQWFGIDTGDASGRLVDAYVGLDYRLGRRFGLGLAYNDVTMNIKAEDSGGFQGQLDWGYSGWLVYFKTSFGL